MMPFVFLYRNFRKEISRRQVRPLRLWFGSTEYHPEPQWLLKAFDLDKKERRDFAMNDINATVDWKLISEAPIGETECILFRKSIVLKREFMAFGVVIHNDDRVFGIANGYNGINWTHYAPRPEGPPDESSPTSSVYHYTSIRGTGGLPGEQT